jgi:hypothetical protein
MNYLHTTGTSMARIILLLLACSFSLYFFSCKPAALTTVNPNADSLAAEAPKKPSKNKPDTVPTQDYYAPDFFRYDNHTYASNIRTIQLFREGWEFAVPLITFGTSEKLQLEFDDLDGDYKSYKYTLIHCSASWKPTDLIPSEYLEGLTEDNITQFEYSFNTLQPYTHYSLSFPNENVKPLISGNYLLKVYLDNSDQTIVFTRKLMIVEPKVTVNMQVKRATNIDYHNYKQEVDFTIDASDYLIDNPYVDMKVILMQNGRWDNAKYDLKPKYVKGSLYDFDYEDENVFSGGNEFRRFDIKSLKWNSEFIRNIMSDSSGYHVSLKDDERATFKIYYSEKDINGKYLIRSEDNVRNSSIEAEYVWVHFFLRYDAPLIDGNLYVFGALNDWLMNKNNQMIYNYQKKGYECTLYLKQGYYNYQYIFLENGASIGDEAFIEGMHFETENDYTVFVYNREKGTMYDRLVGVKQINTYSSQ